jgi:hypothetical protein
MFARALLPVITLGKLLITAPAIRTMGLPPHTLQPWRVPVRDSREDTLAEKTLRPLLARVDAFTRKHPEFSIAAPYTTFSKLWEVRNGDSTTAYDNGFRMIDDLEARYPE